MASLETNVPTGKLSPDFDKLLKDISNELSPEELKRAVSSIKSTFKGKFEDQQEQDLYSCLHLFVNQGVVSEDNLTMLESFVTQKTSKKEAIQEKIKEFKTIRQREPGKTKKELTGRGRDLDNVLKNLTTGRSSVMNLYGSSGVGKTALALETLTKWPGRKFKVDLRGVNEMKSVHFHVLNALTGSEQTVLIYEVNPVIGQMQQLMQDGQSDILLLLDNVDQFAGGEGDAATLLNTNFVTLLGRLARLQGNSKLKILMTSRTTFQRGDSLDVDDYEVKALDDEVSSALLKTHGDHNLGEDESREKLLQKCRGNPLILNGMAAILRQRIANDKKLLETLEQESVAGVPETRLPSAEKVTQEREKFDYREEGIDKEQETLLRKMFSFLPSKRLKESAVSMSLFCRPFSAQVAAAVLGVEEEEAVISLEALRNSKIVAIDSEAKVLSYDIHPLMRKFLRRIGNSNIFLKVYQKARDRFCNLFMSRVLDISGLLDKDYIEAFNRFDLDKPNFELALNISLQSDRLIIPEKHQESVKICYLFEAMLNEKQRRNIFNSWAEKAEEDGKEGSLLRAELKCREALEVLHLEGWQKALEVLKMANDSLKTIQKGTKSSMFFRLTRSSFLFVQGEVYYRAGNLSKALTVLHHSLEIMEDLLQNHTSTSRCLNAIGNCHNKLGETDEAIKYYTRAYEMRKELSGSVNHFDMPFFKSQIGTVYEGRKDYHKAIECYQEALELAKELKIPGMLNTALYNRNIANAYAWLREFEAAYHPAKKAYEIRKDILGIHPWTARSAFQMAEICLSLKDFVEAEEYYEEAWSIEKSLGQGNHSEVMVRIVQSCEAMLRGVRKEEFQKESFEFYLRYWDEEREYKGFEFSLANKKVIDSITERLSELGDSQTQKKFQRETLWFYEGVWNSPDTKKLPRQQREEILQTLLRLCNMLREKNLLKKYEAEAFRFYEMLWKKSKAEMEQQDRIGILTTLERYALSFKEEKKAQKYGNLLKEAKQSGTLVGAFRALLPFGSAAEQQSSDDDGDSDDEDFDVHDDDSDSSNGSQDLDEPDPGKIKIYEETVTSEGDYWDLKEGAVHITFPPDAVSEPTKIVVHRWKSQACSPQLQEHEAVVSNVIEISTGTGEALEFKTDVNLVLSHSAPDLHGYELVVFKLTDRKTNEWEEVPGIEDFRSFSDIENEYSSAKGAPNFYFPVVQAEITECSTYAVVFRLRSSPPYAITPNGGSFNMPDYPSVSVIIPKKAVASKKKIPLKIKVQEVSGEEFQGKDILVGPILRIVCNESVDLLQPVTIQLPLSLAGEQSDVANQSTCRVRVLFLRSDGDQKEWIEITNDLTSPPSFVGGIVRFQVHRFSWYVCLVDWHAEQFSVAGVIGYLSKLIWNPPQLAVFFAYFPPEERPDSRYILCLICCPCHRRNSVVDEIEKENIKSPTEANSRTKMIPGHDKAYISLFGEITPVNKDDMFNQYLLFERDTKYKEQVPVRVISDKGLSGVKFYSSQNLEKEKLLCSLNLRVPPRTRNFQTTPVEFFGVPVNDKILLEAPADLVLSVGKRFVERQTYSDHHCRLSSGTSEERVLQSFFQALAAMTSELQEQCLEALVDELSANQGKAHVVERLREGENVVRRPAGKSNQLLRNVSEKVGNWWKKLARELNLTEGKIEAKEQEEDDDQERCYKALKEWCQENGEQATIRKLMLALNKTGLAEVNKDVINCIASLDS